MGDRGHNGGPAPHDRDRYPGWLVRCLAVGFVICGLLFVVSSLLEPRPPTHVLKKPPPQPWQEAVVGVLCLWFGTRLWIVGRRIAASERAWREVAPRNGQTIERVLPGPDGTQRIVIFRRASGTFGCRVERFADDPLERAWVPVPGYVESFTDSADAAADEALGRVRWADPEPTTPRAGGL